MAVLQSHLGREEEKKRVPGHDIGQLFRPIGGKGVDVTRRDLCKEHKETPTPAKVLLSFYFFCCFFFFSAFLKKTKQNTKQIKKHYFAKNHSGFAYCYVSKNNRSSLFTGVTPSFESHMRPYYLYTISSITHLLYTENNTQKSLRKHMPLG